MQDYQEWSRSMQDRYTCARQMIQVLHSQHGPAASDLSESDNDTNTASESATRNHSESDPDERIRADILWQKQYSDIMAKLWTMLPSASGSG